MRFQPWLAPVTALALVAALGACRGQPSPTPEPTPEPASQWPTLRVLEPEVAFRMQEADELEEVAPGTSIAEVPAGANAVTRVAGRAMLEWPAFLSADLLGQTDLLLGLSLPAERSAVLDQATGTVRYALQGPGEPANVEIRAAWAGVQLDAGVADVIVSLVPGAEPAAWVVVLDGQADVTVGDDSGSAVTVAAGKAAAFTERGALPVPLDVDRAAVLSWFDDFAAGLVEDSLAAVAFRCEVTADAPLLLAPDADGEESGNLARAGALVSVDGRSLDGAWLYVRTLATREAGWVSADALRCLAPVSHVSVQDMEEEEEELEPTAAPTLPPRPAVVVSPPPTPVPAATATPSATPTPSGQYTIKFWADRETITVPECTVLRWETDNISQVFYQGRGVVGNGSSEECPTSDATYELRVVRRDGQTETKTVKIKVRQPRPTDVPPTQAPTPEPPTQEPTPEPPTQEPTPEPTPEGP